MRLIKVSDLSFKEFNEKNTPPYAILSHAWEDGEEVSYQDMLLSHRAVRKRSGYQKITNCAREAKDHNLQWIWCDTCCIDKSSSAELTEAINSMYAYYQHADVCFAFLADVDFASNFFHTSSSLWSEESRRQIQTKLSRSRWFSRGWTLQELIAPKNLHFFSSKWTFLCDKGLIANHISIFTGIPAQVLKTGDPLVCSVAQRLSWAATRQTTRTEDIAYCLLGLLEVNMPLLYGENEKAFMRLQEEIIRNSTDQSIFAWEFKEGIKDPLSHMTGVLAESPQNFKNCGDITELLESDDDSEMSAFAMTNLGLNISLPTKTYNHGLLCASLSCFKGADAKQGRAQIYLRKLRVGLYARIPPRTLPSDHPLDAEPLQLIIAKRVVPQRMLHFHDVHCLCLSYTAYTGNNTADVFIAPHFETPRLIAARQTSLFYFQRPIPRPNQDKPWAMVVVDLDYYLATIQFGIRPGSHSDVLWAQVQHLDNPPRDSLGRICSVEAIARANMGVIVPVGLRDDLQYGKRYAIPCDYKKCTFKVTQDLVVSVSSKKAITLSAKFDIQGGRLVLLMLVDIS